jgi:hypothetical protein
MTTIRKIVTSKIDGDNANNTSTNEIRPYGEIAVYVGDDDKLELLMFDGVRTHLKSKVLNKGTFYGGDGDSGDGAGLDTIKLIPDAELYNNSGGSSHQYIIVDPTAPNHIHLRAGGTIDQSFADLFLGGEKNHVKVSDGYDNVQITTDAGEGTYTWTFDNNGKLTFPGGSYSSYPSRISANFGIVLEPTFNGSGIGPHLRVDYNDGILVSPVTNDYIVGDKATGLYLEGAYLSSGTVLPGDVFIDGGWNSNTQAKGAVNIGRSRTGAVNIGQTGVNTTITFADGAEQTTAWTGSVSSLVSGVHSVTLDETRGELYLPRELHFLGDGSYPGTITWNPTELDLGLAIRAATNKSIFIEADSGSKRWKFENNGNLTLPSGGDILDSTGTSVLGGADTGTVSFNFNQISGNTNDGAGASYTKTVDVNGNDYTTGSGSIGFLNFGADGEVEQVKAGWTVTFASGETRIVAQDAWQPIGSYWNISFTSGYNWSAGSVMPVTFSSPDYVAASDPVLELKPDADTNNSWTFNGDGSITFPDATVQTTAYVPTDLTGYATETYVNTQVSNLVNAAPTTLDTLNELAAALGNDANFATSVSTAIGLKANTADLASVATSGSYDDLTNKPNIPADVSDLTDTEGLLLDPLNLTATAAAATVTSTAASVGYMGIPQNERTGDYTLVMSDAGKHLLMKSSGAITIPSNSSVPFPIGTTIDILSYGGTTTTIATTSPEFLVVAGVGFPAGTRTLGGYGWAKLIKIESGAWVIRGEGLS